ncbi:hypothetical protein [Clostridium sartagoforme]|uniref:hypothetical protein n=1 Tax=Clostridium sartagoforme TaxID=84031 RepID=UPI001FA976A2|nr:hypothetical protein [Clostridium sartagoforme]
MIEEVNGYWNTDKLEYPFGRGIYFQIEVSNIEEIRDRLIRKEEKFNSFISHPPNFYILLTLYHI